MQVVRTLNFRKFYALLRELPHADKEDLVLEFTAGRTQSLHNIRPEEFACMIGAMEAMVGSTGSPTSDQFDKARKRVMGAIGGYLRATKHAESDAIIKGVALRACGGKYKQFNQIPLDRLNSLYNAFKYRREDLQAVMDEELGAKSIDAELERLRGLMQEAVDGEEFELAERYKSQIEKLSNVKI